MDIAALVLYSKYGYCQPMGVSPSTAVDLDVHMEQVLRYLDRATRCSASGLLLANGHHAQVMLYRSRPVDDLFLQAMQQRIVSIYRVCVGPAAAEPEIEVTVLGDAVSGPYEPPRSLLTAPILCAGRVAGMLAIASVFPEAFCSRDLCTLSAVAAQASAALGRVPPGTPVLSEALLGGGTADSAQGRMWNQVGRYLASISNLASHWKAQDDDVPDALVQDLVSIEDNARQIRELLAC
jgi:hypothetical protein